MFTCHLKKTAINVQLVVKFERVQKKKKDILTLDLNAYCFMLTFSDFD